MLWVPDASITMCWCFEDETTPETDALYERLNAFPAIVPQIWPLEVANVLRLATRKGRLTRAKRAEFIATLRNVPIEIDSLTYSLAFSDIMALADTHDLTIYDACYLELAMRLGAPLATLDQALTKAARKEHVTVL